MSPPVDTKRAANELARVLAATPEGPKILSLLRSVGLIGEPPVSPADGHARSRHESPPRPSGYVGVWQPRTVAGQRSYVRDTDCTEAHLGLWANTVTIPPKGKRRRIVFLGESVARGFFFDPDYCPASVLEQMLGAVPSLDGVEVIDLARTDQSLGGLLAVTRDALALEPDAVVVFAGNNWLIYNPEIQEQFPALAALLREGGDLAAVNRHIARWLAGQTEGFVRVLESISREHGVPVVVMIPEFNLGDWENGVVPCAPVLRQPAASMRWVEARRAALAALERGHVSAAAALALELRTLDGGVSAAALELHAECQRRMGELRAARQLLEAARDAEMWRIVQMTPRCFSAVQDTLREAGSRGAISVVDLPRGFEEWLDGELPGRRLFLDYCHLTSAGIQVAMAMAAARLASVFGSAAEIPWRELVAAGAHPVSEVAGRAHLLAAVHNANWGQRYEIVDYHVREAARIAPALATTCRDLVDLCSRVTLPVYTSAFDRLVQRGYQKTLARAIQCSGQLNVLLCDAMANAFESVDGGLRSLVNDVRTQEHGVLTRPRDLLDGYYCSDSWVRPERDWIERAAFYKAFDAESRFLFVAERSAPVRFRLTFRVPGAGAGDALSMRLNEASLGTFAASPQWSSESVVSPAEMIRPGINELILRWPLGAGAVDEPFLDAVDALESALAPRLYVTFGHVHELVASGAPWG